ncbi:alpha/beta hydrolase [Actinosynnema sp. NPDC050436]|uniref:alpha/beta fold hydrolase n=1 Tax=Actinosynnema sp. NPDC050436 TaxID=3155659 RepID=UPI0033C7E92F
MPRTADLRRLQSTVDRDRAVIADATRTATLPDGSTIRLARFGSGPTVVCAPMIAELNFVYLPHVRALSEEFEFVLYEPRISRTTRVGAADRARELLAVVDAVGARAHVLSWSDAGSVAYLAGLRRPEALRSVVFLGLADRYTFPPPLGWLTRALDRWPVQRLFPTVLLRLLLSHFLGGDRLTPRWVFRETGKIPRLADLFKHSVLPCMTDHRPTPGRFTIPSVLIGGDRDTLVTTDQMRRMAALAGEGCDFVLVPGGEHILGYAAPDPVNTALREFYARLGDPHP